MNAPEFSNPPPDAVAVALLSINDITASHSNPRKRFDDAYIAELAESIKAHGLIQPITVRPIPLDSIFALNKARKAGDETLPPTYEIVVGECRWRAAKLAGLVEIPAFWRELDDKQVLEIQVVENLQRRDVHPIEEATGYSMLMQMHGYTADTLAAKIGKSRSYIYGKLKLIDLCREVREAFYAGTLSESTALLIARIPGEKLQKACAKEVTTGYNGEPLSHRAAKQHIRNRYTLSLTQATFSPADATLLPKAGPCSDCPKRSGNFQDLFNDITDPDVCTDPDCYETKRRARRDQLIANAEKRKIPVFIGDQGRQALNGAVEYMSLDAEVDDDAEGRTYRQILGDKVKPEALIEFPYGKRDLTECAPLNTLEAALRKAGWKPQENEPPVTRDMTPEQKAKVEAEHAQRQAETRQREERQQLAETETTIRTAAMESVLPKLRAMTLAPSPLEEQLLYLLAEGWLRDQLKDNEMSDFEQDLQEHLDPTYALPEEFDEGPEIERAVALLRSKPLANAISLMLGPILANEAHVSYWNLQEHHLCTPHTLRGLSELVGAPFESVSHPAPTPTKAAQAKTKGAPKAAPAADQSPAKKPAAKKGKAKADPAPASPANEAAAPPKATERPAWPFPTGAQA